MKKPKELTELNYKRPPTEFTCLGLHFTRLEGYRKGDTPSYRADIAEYHKVYVFMYHNTYRVEGRPFGAQVYACETENKSLPAAIRKALAALALVAQRELSRTRERHAALTEKLPKFEASLAELEGIVKAATKRKRSAR